MKQRIVPFWFPNLGCPTRCSYCDQSAACGEAIAMPTPDQIAATIRDAAREEAKGQLEVAFYGGTFTGLPTELQETLLEPASALLRQGLLAGIRVSTHPRFTTAETVGLLCRHGVTTVELGVQSFSAPVLKHNGRDYDGDEALQACRTVQRHGLDLIVQLMPFLALAQEEDDLQAARLVAELAPAGVRLFPTVALAGTRLAEWWRAGTWPAPSIAETAHRVAKMLRIISTAGVPVLRIGLQSSRSLDAAVLAGPYHPALGELCRATLLADVLDSALETIRGAGLERSQVIVEPALASLLTGHKQWGLRALKEMRPANSFTWKLRAGPSSQSQLETCSFWQSEMFSVSLSGNVVHVVRG